MTQPCNLQHWMQPASKHTLTDTHTYVHAHIPCWNASACAPVWACPSGVCVCVRACVLAM